MTTINFNHELYRYELIVSDDNVEIYCKNTDLSGFGQFSSVSSRVEVEIPFGPCFVVSQGLMNKGYTVSVKTEKVLVLNERA